MHQHHPAGYGDLDFAALLRFVAGFRKTFPDLQDNIDLQVAEGDVVVTQFISTGTQLDPWELIAPSGRRMSWTGAVIDRVRDGRIHESWGYWDMLGMVSQMGSDPSPCLFAQAMLDVRGGAAVSARAQAF